MLSELYERRGKPLEWTFYSDDVLVSETFESVLNAQKTFWKMIGGRKDSLHWEITKITG